MYSPESFLIEVLSAYLYHLRNKQKVTESYHFLYCLNYLTILMSYGRIENIFFRY